MSIRTFVESWEGADADLLVELNEPKHKRRTTSEDGRPAGFSTVATMAADLGMPATVGFQLAITGAANAAESSGDIGTATILRAFLLRFETTQEGLDFANEELRATLKPILEAADLPVEPYLALGYTLDSDAGQILGRAAVQGDIDLVRQEIASEALAIEYDAKFNEHVAAGMADGDRAGVVAGLRLVADALEAS